MLNKVIIIMGVSGSGKTTVGELLSQMTGWPFYDADSFHSNANVDKMKAGIPLTDEDRWPWLQSINEFATQKIATSNMILACSALKEIYRQKLSGTIEEHCKWVLLKGSYEEILKRMEQRQQHYMPASLLQSQFNLLEEPPNSITEDISQPPATIAQHIIDAVSR